ncbi:MAG: bacteriohemerythrin [Propionivibrio sp.]
MATQLFGTFMSVALLMAAYEALKESFFNGQLTPWESHAITVFVTAAFATLAAFYIRVQADKLTRAAESAHAKATGIITFMSDGIVITDERGTIETFNASAESIFKYRAEEVIGRNIKLLMSEPNAGDHEGYMSKHLATGMPRIFSKKRRELQGLLSDGQVFPMDLITSEMRVDGRSMFIDIIRDISEYKQAENELHRLRQAEKQAFANIQKELSVAAAIQANMLPKGNQLFPQFPQIKAFGLAIPAKEVGGDFFDAFAFDEEHIVIAIGDVSGKGVPAALFMMKTMTLLRSKIRKQKKFATALTTINRLLCENNDTNMFVTAFVGMLNVMTGHLQYFNAGHNLPLLARFNESFGELCAPKNILLGVHKEAHYEIAHTYLAAGDTLVLYTDGVTEAENDRQEFYSLERATELLTATYSDVRILVHSLKADVAMFCGGHPQSDDITIMAIQYDPNVASREQQVFFEWSDSLSVGISEIDEQHKNLVELINQLYEEVIVKSADGEIIKEALIELVHYTVVHFSLEESLFTRYGYPDLEAHCQYHRALKERLFKFQEKGKMDSLVVNTELLSFLKKWLQSHIMIEDKRSFLHPSMSLVGRMSDQAPSTRDELAQSRRCAGRRS